VDSAWFSNDCSYILVGADGKLLYSQDGGASFLMYADATAAVMRRLGADVMGREVLVKIPKIEVDPSGAVGFIWYTMVGPRDGVKVLGTSGKALSRDGGQNWTVQESPTPMPGTDAAPGWVAGLSVPRMDPYYRISPEGLQRSLNNGKTYQTLVLKPTLGAIRLLAAHDRGTYVMASTGRMPSRACGCRCSLRRA
jgi:hypothetical protein